MLLGETLLGETSLGEMLFWGFRGTVVRGICRRRTAISLSLDGQSNWVLLFMYIYIHTYIFFTIHSYQYISVHVTWDFSREITGFYYGYRYSLLSFIMNLQKTRKIRGLLLFLKYSPQKFWSNNWRFWLKIHTAHCATPLGQIANFVHPKLAKLARNYDPRSAIKKLVLKMPTGFGHQKIRTRDTG
jgi:hypothetical protein